jgi:uncharacterized membrane protein
MTREMSPGRLEAFSDGVIAIIITIMVLELKVPHDTSPGALLSPWPTFIGYGLSYLYVAVYWINHHHLFHFVRRVDHRILWANIIFMFFLSLIPFFTEYVGQNRLNRFSAMLYAGIMLACGVAFTVLRATVARQFEEDAHLHGLSRAGMLKNLVALGLYAVGIAAAYVHPGLTLAIIFIVALMYVVPTAWMRRHPSEASE